MGRWEIIFWDVVCLRGEDFDGQTNAAKWPLLTNPATVSCQCAEIVARDSERRMAEGMEGPEQQQNVMSAISVPA
jgi:hypothetical protein